MTVFVLAEGPGVGLFEVDNDTPVMWGGTPSRAGRSVRDGPQKIGNVFIVGHAFGEAFPALERIELRRINLGKKTCVPWMYA